MAESLGKKFENSFKADWMKCFPEGFIYRLPDQMSGFAGGGGSNPCDFFGFTDGKLFMIECKEHNGASIPFTAIRQAQKLISFIGKKDVFPGVLVWLSEKDIIFWLPADTLQKMIADGLKSVGLKTIAEKTYNIILIPAEKKRTFLSGNYSYLVSMVGGQYGKRPE